MSDQSAVVLVSAALLTNASGSGGLKVLSSESYQAMGLVVGTSKAVPLPGDDALEIPLRVGDLVEVDEETAGAIKVGGVARITKVHDDGTYDCTLVLTSGRRTKVRRERIKRFAFEEGPKGVGATEGQRQTSRRRKPLQRFVAGVASGVGRRKKADAPESDGGNGGVPACRQDDGKSQEPAADKKRRHQPTVEELQLRELEKVLAKIEKLDRYGFFCEEDAWEPRDPSTYQGSLTFDDLRKNITDNKYTTTRRYSCITGELLAEGNDVNAKVVALDVSVDWALLEADLMLMFDEASAAALELQVETSEDCTVDKDTLGFQAARLRDIAKGALEQAREKGSKSVEEARKNERLAKLQADLVEFSVSGEWRRHPFPDRKYEMISGYVPGENGFSDEECAAYLSTKLDGFLGQPYNYDDQELSEQWMRTLSSDAGLAKAKKGAVQKEMVEAQVQSVLHHMVRQVQDRYSNMVGTLKRPEKRVGKQVAERPVWGIDACTRRMLEMALEMTDFKTDEQKTYFIEKRLLPTVNLQPHARAHDMHAALDAIATAARSTGAEKRACEVIRKAIAHLGEEHFRIHPKGTGAICIEPEGIQPHVFVTEYLGELYPAWRWCEKQDAIEDALKQLALKPALPDFYNILLERPRSDEAGYCLAFVDASRRANLGSSLSHSCNSNCYTEVVGKDGKLTIAVCTDRSVEYGEELTMDYCSYTHDEDEYLAAVCLCGASTCRSSFLHFAGYDIFHKVLERNYGSALRFAALTRTSVGHTVKQADLETLAKHGIKGAAFQGEEMPAWLQRFAADVLRFVEFERRVLPYKLMEPMTDGSPSVYTYATADQEARTVMEQRVQSLVSVLSQAYYILSHQRARPAKGPWRDCPSPLERMEPQSIVAHLWNGPHSVAKKTVAAARRHVVEFIRDLPADHGKREQAKTWIDHMEAMLGEPMGRERNDMKAKLTGLRKALLELHLVHGCNSRHLAAADVLLLLCNTECFIKPHLYDAVTSTPVEVTPRDLGQRIQRSKLKAKEAGQSHEEYKEQHADSSHRHHQHCNGKHGSPNRPPHMEPTDCEVLPGAHGVPTNEAEKKRKRPRTCKDTNQASTPDVCGDDEVVHVFTRKYSPVSLLHQLLQWYNNGQGTKEPDLMGCCILPDINDVYACEKSYGRKERMALYKHMEDNFTRIAPFPAALQQHLARPRPFNETAVGNIVYGSPLLDFQLSSLWGLGNTLEQLESELDYVNPKVEAKRLRKAGKLKGKAALEGEDGIGEELPPVPPATWVQCEEPSCMKWRKLPWYMEADQLPTPFYCNLNTWRASEASCDAPEEEWDEEEDLTLPFNETMDGLKVGDWIDVHCEKNKVWYEAVVRERDGDRVKVHFYRWPSQFDEWIPISDRRFAPHKTFTPVTKDYLRRMKQKREEAQDEDDDEGDDEEEDGDKAQITKLKADHPPEQLGRGKRRRRASQKRPKGDDSAPQQRRESARKRCRKGAAGSEG